MSRSAWELVRTTTGTRLTHGWCLTSLRTANPSFLGRLRSSRIRSGRGEFSKPRERFRKARAFSPSVATLMWFSTFPNCRASWINSTSPGLSSTNRISAGLPCTFISRSLLRVFWNCEMEGRSRPWLGLHPDLSAVPLDDLLADREPDAGARIFRFGVQSLEDLEDPVGMVRIDANTVIPHGKQPLRAGVHRGNLN